MSKVILELFVGIKNFLKEDSAKTYILFGLIIFLIIYCYVDIRNSQYHFYKNLNTSLEIIYNDYQNIQSPNRVEFDTYDGKIKHNLTTEEKLIRKQNRKLNLYYLLK